MIAILLSTYNGEKYLEEQLDSILNQTCSDWRLYIRDDGSTDRTLEIIENYVSKYDQIIAYEGVNRGLGAALSFMELLSNISAEYYMFCDQDDVWLPQKIDIMLNEMRQLEKMNKNVPILLHSDLAVVNSNLDIINGSFWNYINIDPRVVNKEFLYITNSVTGCATFFNKMAREISIDNYKSELIIMHDYWVPICVKSANGIIFPIDKPLIFYRQHEKNVLGAGDGRMKGLRKKLSLVVRNYSYNKALFKMVNSRLHIDIFSFIMKKISFFMYRRLNKKNVV